MKVYRESRFRPYCNLFTRWAIGYGISLAFVESVLLLNYVVKELIK